MKNLFFGLLVTFSLNANADVISEVLSMYEETDVNGRCTVTYEDNILRIHGSKVRDDFLLPIDEIELQGPTVVGKYGNYNGYGEVFLMMREYSLMVIGTWEDRENGYDNSSFCELTLKE